MPFNKQLTVCALLISAVLPQIVAAAPEPLVPDLVVKRILSVGNNTIRIAADPTTNTLYKLKTNGEIWRIDIEEKTQELVYNRSDHGLAGDTQGLDIGSDGTFYLSGFKVSGPRQTAKVVKGVVDAANGERQWSVLATTEPFELSDSWYNHRVNDVAVSPDNQYVYLNSGSRTDHGEIQTNNGNFPGLRESPLTAIMLRMPADGENIVLPNDRQQLREMGYLYAEGLRNSFSLAFDSDGELFATENGPNRDMSEELNWIREGRHYGFPWRLGGLDNPQQFPGYNPRQDPLLKSDQVNAGNGRYSDDPDFPPAPTAFTEPVINMGPDADKYWDPESGEVKDGSDEGRPVHTFTAHRSPLGLVFDRDRVLAAPFTGDGFVLSWTDGINDKLLGRSGDPSQDILHLKLERTPDGENYRAHVHRIVAGFANPVDAEMIHNRLYVIEWGGGRGLYEVTFPMGITAVLEEQAAAQPSHSTLMQNYPNPFNSSTTIGYLVEAEGMVELSIYDMTGQKVRTLVHATQEAGPYSVRWDGLGDSGQAVASGTYIYTISLGDFSESRTLTLLK